jgi:hypothetical protein
MNWMDNLERKIGRYAIPNITRIMVIASLLGTVLELIPGTDTLISYLDFSAYHILHGQIWRLVTWIILPSTTLSIWTLLFIVCLLMLGQNMEMSLGSFRMNVYFIGGILLSDVVGILIYLIFRIPVFLTSYYMLFSLYLMLGLLMPDAEVRLYFVLPIKMKWLLIVYFISLAYEVYEYFRFGYLQGGAAGMWIYGLMYGTQIVLALVNLFVFIYFCRHHVSRKQKKRIRIFEEQFANPRPGSGITKHKCVICGRTELDDPNLTFRYCSKCAGSREYCQDHLFTHTHIREM